MRIFVHNVRRGKRYEPNRVKQLSHCKTERGKWYEPNGVEQLSHYKNRTRKRAELGLVSLFCLVPDSNTKALRQQE